MNDVPVKIKGVANHQDFAGVGVAVPDKLQVYVFVTLNHHLPLFRTKSLAGRPSSAFTFFACTV